MATTAPTTTTSTEIADVIRRHLKRTLPVRLSREEMTTIAIDAAKKRRRLRELEADLDAEKKRRKQQIDELQTEIDTHDRELDTGEQDRVVLCDEIFRSGTVYIRRSDTLDEIEPRPATAQEAQRYLPAVESAFAPGPGAPLLDQAVAAQAAEDSEDDDGVPEDLLDDPDPDGLEDDGLGDVDLSVPPRSPMERMNDGEAGITAERARRAKEPAARGGKGRGK